MVLRRIFYTFGVLTFPVPIVFGVEDSGRFGLSVSRRVGPARESTQRRSENGTDSGVETVQTFRTRGP